MGKNIAARYVKTPRCVKVSELLRRMKMFMTFIHVAFENSFKFIFRCPSAFRLNTRQLLKSSRLSACHTIANLKRKSHIFNNHKTVFHHRGNFIGLSFPFDRLQENTKARNQRNDGEENTFHEVGERRIDKKIIENVRRIIFALFNEVEKQS